MSFTFQIRSSSTGDVQRCRSKLESMFHYGKPIPEEIIEKPVGLPLDEKNIGNNPRCFDCQAKGAVLCPTCSGSGLYIDSILESQGIIVKVRCLGNPPYLIIPVEYYTNSFISYLFFFHTHSLNFLSLSCESPINC